MLLVATLRRVNRAALMLLILSRKMRSGYLTSRSPFTHDSVLACLVFLE